MKNKKINNNIILIFIYNKYNKLLIDMFNFEKYNRK